MSLTVLAASFGRRPGRPGGAAEDRPATRCARAGRRADDSQRLAVAMTRGVAAIPAGSERATECATRRVEIVQGVESVLRALEATEEALRVPAVLRAGSGGEPSPELRHHLKCLRWAASMTNALQTAARTLKTLDSFKTPEPEYAEIAEQLSIIKDTLRDLWGIVLVACNPAPPRPERAAEPAALGPLGKLEGPSETCSTASGWSSEASSEADCDSPRHYSSCEALAAAPAPDEICKGGSPCASNSSWAANLYWA